MQPTTTPAALSSPVQPDAAGIDLGAQHHYVCVPADRDPEPVRRFDCFTPDLHARARWLKDCGVTTVALEATGIYGVPVVEVLEDHGLTPVLVDTRRVKCLPGRKSDVLDCPWLQYLHAHGLLAGAFLPHPEAGVLRSYTRQRQTLVEQASDQIRRMHKALEQMNVQLHKVVTDISGVSGMAIVRAILSGERDPHALAGLRRPGCKRPEKDFVKALEGTWRQEHVFALKQAVEHYDFLHGPLAALDAQLETYWAQRPSTLDPSAREPAPGKKNKRTRRKNEPHFDLRGHAHRVLGVDLTRIDGVDALTAQVIAAECGFDLSAFPSAGHFCSWLGLCPGTRITGGKRKSSHTRTVTQRAATALRRAAQSLWKAQSALGGFYRRMRARLGPAQAVTATAHKLARIIYSLITRRQEYVDPGTAASEALQRQAALKHLRRRARHLGLALLDPDTGELFA